MNKAYIVKSVYVNGAETTIGICPTKELANKLVQKVENLHDLEDNEITRYKYKEMVSFCLEKDENVIRPLCEVLIELFPEYSVRDIEEAYREYSNGLYGYTYTSVIDMFTNESDIISYGINS